MPFFISARKWDLPAWMERHLQAIHPHLMWEYGQALTGKGHRLVITPEQARHLRPMTDTILARAPKLKGWQFLGYRPPENLENAQLTVEARTGGDLSDVAFQARQGECNLIDLTFFFPHLEDDADEQAGHSAFVAAETLLGEERLDQWIGLIDVAPLPENRKNRGLLPLDKLFERVDVLVNQTRDQLPATPFLDRVDSAEWTLFKLEPEESEDYSGRADLFVSRCANETLWRAARSQPGFVSERFSKCGETFCYLKLDGSQGLDAERFRDKSEIEDALDELLRPPRLGCHIGGGTGLRYSYIDLAVTDLEKAIPAIRQRLRAGNVPKRSWILFFNGTLAGEWIGIYDDTPPPPMDSLE
jgi:hypothetical protein